jgi:hypothetical protein
MIRIEKISSTFFRMIDDDGDILDTFEKLGILMDRNTHVLLKWGNYNRVKEHFMFLLNLYYRVDLMDLLMI